jgi:hypothetical protein
MTQPTPRFDLGPAASAVATLFDGRTDDDLSRPTPCDIPVAALLDHVWMAPAHPSRPPPMHACGARMGVPDVGYARL